MTGHGCRVAGVATATTDVTGVATGVAAIVTGVGAAVAAEEFVPGLRLEGREPKRLRK